MIIFVYSFEKIVNLICEGIPKFSFQFPKLLEHILLYHGTGDIQMGALTVTLLC
jgi:hypothetical protein